jgi:hypothetical protein
MTTSGINFAAFKAGPGGDMSRRLRIDLDVCSTWTDFAGAASVARKRSVDHGSGLPGLARNIASDLWENDGSREVLLAVLCAADMAELADGKPRPVEPQQAVEAHRRADQRAGERARRCVLSASAGLIPNPSSRAALPVAWSGDEHDLCYWLLARRRHDGRDERRTDRALRNIR